MLQKLVRRRRAGAEERIDEVVAHIQDTRQRRETATTLDLLQRHLTTLLHRNDRLAMAWGIESRFPFLGHRLASIALNLPHRARIRGSWNALDPRHPFIVDKWCVRRVARRYLPESIRRRPKKCFPVSIARRLRVDSGFFDGGFIADFYGLPRSALRELAPTRPTEWSTQLLYVEVWAQLFVMGRRREEVQSNIHRHVSTAHERPKIDRTRVTGHRASAVGRRRIA